MKIAFESQLFLDNYKTGIGWCADNVVKELAADPKYQCQCDYMAFHQRDEQRYPVHEYENYGVKMNPCKWFHPTIYKLIWPFFPIPYSLFYGGDRKITQFFNFVVPPGVKGKKVTIVHDMAYKAYPETVYYKTRRWLQLTLKGSCRRADAIITVSEFSKQEIVKYLGVKPEKITVMPNGVDLDLYHPNYTDDQVNGAKEHYKIQGEYFLYLGTLEPRKNIERVIEAYDKLLKANGSENTPKLVLAGGKGWLYDSIFAAVHKLKIENQVIFTGYVDAEDVPLLMKGAAAFLFPSLYEGFGMPPLEAMACGTTVITSNCSSLPEVVGDAGILVDPLKVDEIKEAMERVMRDKSLRMELGKKGIERAQKYTWKHSVEILKQVYEKLV